MNSLRWTAPAAGSGWRRCTLPKPLLLLSLLWHSVSFHERNKSLSVAWWAWEAVAVPVAGLVGVVRWSGDTYQAFNIFRVWL